MPEPDPLNRFSKWQPIFAIFLGLFPSMIFSYTADKPLRAFGILFILSAAATLIGALVGFLFGVPKSRTDGSGVTAGEQDSGISDSSVGGNRRRRYSDNANLEEVSDWLTKIIVGLGLVEITKISSTFEPIKQVFDPILSVEGTFILIGSFVYFLVLGFIVCYIWTRIVFYGILSQADVIRDVVKEEVEGEVGKIREQFEESESINKDLNELYTALAVASKTQRRERDVGLLSRLGDRAKQIFVADLTNRKAAILYARYVAEILNEVPHGNTQAIRIIDDFLDAKGKTGQKDRDYADVLFNRVCYCAEIVGRSEEETDIERFTREALRDLEICVSLYPSIGDVAAHDPDLKSIRDSEGFKSIISKTKGHQHL